MRRPFLGFASDCLVRGWLDVDGRRLFEMLTASTEIDLEDVVVQALQDGRTLRAPRLTLSNDELCLVELLPRRGNPARPVRVVAQRFVATLGPYALSATLHSPPSATPVAELLRGPVVMPMTEATVDFELAGMRLRYELSAVGANRGRIDNLQAAYTVETVPWISQTSRG